MKVNYTDYGKTSKVRSRNNNNQSSPHLSRDDIEELNFWFGYIYNCK